MLGDGRTHLIHLADIDMFEKFRPLQDFLDFLKSYDEAGIPY
jgi:hypothetical protein